MKKQTTQTTSVNTYATQAKAIAQAIIANRKTTEKALETIAASNQTEVEALAKAFEGFQRIEIDSPIIDEVVAGVISELEKAKAKELNGSQKSSLKVAIVAITHGFVAPDGTKRSLSDYAQAYRDFATAVFCRKEYTNLGTVPDSVPLKAGNSVGGFVPKSNVIARVMGDAPKAKKVGKVEKWTMPVSESAKVAALLALMDALEIAPTATQKKAIKAIAAHSAA